MIVMVVRQHPTQSSMPPCSALVKEMSRDVRCIGDISNIVALLEISRHITQSSMPSCPTLVKEMSTDVRCIGDISLYEHCWKFHGTQHRALYICLLCPALVKEMSTDVRCNGDISL
ncbi:hypothetical protein PoB_007411900 [Plakobranchus ocellatus]|uniref:Uncharacterized protein n=1 Tax=Plakobranchus ocellatus TaxID=259542 RepID=A0AAV4DTX5_9GAST|nr:hypothetical protein PoB_007411900 [Plakobranchus ocellatus]